MEKSDDEEPDMRERCVITDDWKLILNTSRPPELYDRRNPQPDTENLFGRPQSKAVVLDMAARMNDWAEKTGDDIAKRRIIKWRPLLSG